MCSIALLMGVNQQAIIIDIDTETRDPKEQAPKIKRLIGGEAPFLLVTSTSHMPRSMALFNGQG